MSSSILPTLTSLMSSSAPQNDKTTSTLSLLSTLLPASPPSGPLISLAQFTMTSPLVPTVVGRAILNAFVLALCGGSGLDEGVIRGVGEGTKVVWEEEEGKWLALGEEAFKGQVGGERRQEVIEGVLEGGGVGWCEEQTSILRHLLSLLLQNQEDWVGAAKVLMGIPLDSTGRMISDQQKLEVYIQIVRLLIEAQEAGQAQTYFNRASLLIPDCQDKRMQLSFKLCQAKIFDFQRRFNDAAAKYHELSFNADIAEEERAFMLGAAVTCAILAPAGPQRSRLLANLYRDDRCSPLSPSLLLPSYKTTILRKMFLDQVLRMEEVKEFEGELGEHQLARLGGGRKVEEDEEDWVVEEGKRRRKGRVGAESVLDKAVMEHNVLACGNVYNDIGFDGLGALLDLMPSAAEAMARQMIAEGRLRAWIDQVDRLIYFEGRSSQDAHEGQATAGGLGIEKVEKEILGMSMTERWDERIKDVAVKVESIANEIIRKELLTVPEPDAMVLT